LILAPRHTKIVNFLKSRHGTRLTVEEIHTNLGGSKAVLYKDLADLAFDGHIHKSKQGARNGVFYSALVPSSPDSSDYEPLSTVTTATLLAMLQKFAEETEYLTKVQRLAWKLPHALARVYSLAIAQTTGTQVLREDLILALEPLREFHKDCYKFTRDMQSVVDSAELQDPAKFQKLLFGDAPVEVLSKLVENLVDNWGERE
jgi:hypothetical protein